MALQRCYSLGYAYPLQVLRVQLKAIWEGWRPGRPTRRGPHMTFKQTKRGRERSAERAFAAHAIQEDQ